jgi:hypothetical protein
LKKQLLKFIKSKFCIKLKICSDTNPPTEAVEEGIEGTIFPQINLVLINEHWEISKFKALRLANE